MLFDSNRETIPTRVSLYWIAKLTILYPDHTGKQER